MKFVRLTRPSGDHVYVSSTIIVEPSSGESTTAARTKITCAGSVRFVNEAVEDVVARIEASFSVEGSA